MILLSIDPGVRGCGIAAWHDKQLLRAGYVDGQSDPKETDLAELIDDTSVRVQAWIFEQIQEVGGPAEVVLEYPQTYDGRAAKGDANDLISLALVAGAIFARTDEPTRLVLPREWKGQVPKKNQHGENPIEQRARGKLSPLELSRVVLPQKKLRHNVWDSVGIGLWHLRR